MKSAVKKQERYTWMLISFDLLKKKFDTNRIAYEISLVVI